MKGLGEHSVLGYCTNVHPGTSTEAILHRIESDCLKVKEKVHPSINFGLGLWLSCEAAQRFKQKENLEKLVDACQRTQLQVFSWNAFPYSDFHQGQVKEKVYRPNWSEFQRLQFTLDLLDIIPSLSKGGGPTEVSISTLPVAYRADRLTSAQIQKAVLHLVEFVKASFHLERKHGLEVYLALEPEPLCYLEKSHEVVMFFKDFLLPLGSSQLRKEMGLSQVDAEELLLRKLRVCYDTCHAAVVYENPQQVLQNYDAVGIRIGKVQLSSALIYDPESLSYELLERLSSDRYLHQVVGRRSDGLLEAYLDLPEALSEWKYKKTLSPEYRIHYHVPIFLREFESLRTTQDHILELISLAQRREITSHWEVETYTWPSLPEAFRGGRGELSDWIAEEVNWVNRVAAGKHDSR